MQVITYDRKAEDIDAEVSREEFEAVRCLKY